jgi:PAS domain S-box-containing protein
MTYDIHAENRVFRELFENSPHSMWVFDLETLGFLAVNDATVERYGYTRDEFLAMKATDIRPVEEVPRFLEHLRHQDSTFVKAGQWRHRKKNGELLYVDITAQKLTFSGRDAEMVLAVDVTAQVDALKRLEQAERKYRSLVEQSLVGIYILKDQRIEYANPHLAQIFGYSMDEFMKLNFLDLAAQEERLAVIEAIGRRLSGKEATGHNTFRGRRKDGSEIIVDIHGTLLDDQGQAALTGVVLDVTEAKRAEERNLQHLAQLERMLQHTIGAITTMGDIRDSYTAGHERRVADLSSAIAAEMGMDAEAQKWLRVAGMVHDTGKIGVPTDILTKPKPLTTHEYGLVQTHPNFGFEILRLVEFPSPIAEVTLQHHERLDGSGYPRGLKGDDILTEARIVAVADVVESMASHRPYRPALGIPRALEEIQSGAGARYDAGVVDACVRLFNERNFHLQ